MKFRKYLGLIVIFTACLNNAKASLIDTDIQSFIDTETHLEWMDFGVNNHFSFSEIFPLLAKGEIYEGWQVADENQVKVMWDSAFFANNPDNLDPNAWGVGWGEASVLANNEAWQEIFSVIGYNAKVYEGTNSEKNYAIALFEGNDGLLKRADFTDYMHPYETQVPGLNFIDKASLVSQSNIDRLRYLPTGSETSTLLVRVVDVPEPNMGILFLISLAVLFGVKTKT